VELATVPNDDRGRLDPALVKEALEGKGSATLVCLENTHIRCGGAALSAE
jgi:hypothetical protein